MCRAWAYPEAGRAGLGDCSTVYVQLSMADNFRQQVLYDKIMTCRLECLYDGWAHLSFVPMPKLSRSPVLIALQQSPGVPLDAYTLALRERLTVMEVGRTLVALHEAGLARPVDELNTANDLACRYEAGGPAVASAP